jgi:hypothetical protein
MAPRGDGPELSRAFGREAFGADPAAYDAVRPGYPAWVFDELVARGALRPGAATFEIGAGTGIATRALLARGAGPLLAIERSRPTSTTAWATPISRWGIA